MSTSASLRALLAQSIDYAGLFPPATLPLNAAFQNFADYMQSDDAWMLSTFVLPVAEFAEALRLVTAFDRQHSFPISALGPKTKNDTEFAQELSKAMSGIAEFAAACGNACEIEQLEMPLP